MLNIVIIEDETKYADELETIIVHEWQAGNIEVSVKRYKTAENFLRRKALFHDVHLIFIDIELSGINGIELAEALREKAYRNMIVFVTNHESYAIDGYAVGAYRYCLKPIDHGCVLSCLDKAREDYFGEYFVYKTGRKQYRVPFSEILCFSASDHYVEIKTAQKGYRYKATLKSVLLSLPDYFVRCHKSCVVNLRHVRAIEGSALRLDDGSELDIGAVWLEDVRNAIYMAAKG